MEHNVCKNKLIITTRGNIEHGEEHYTTIQKQNGDKKEYNTDGYVGTSYHDIVEILDFVGVEYFTVHKSL